MSTERIPSERLSEGWTTSVEGTLHHFWLSSRREAGVIRAVKLQDGRWEAKFVNKPARRLVAIPAQVGDTKEEAALALVTQEGTTA